MTYPPPGSPPDPYQPQQPYGASDPYAGPPYGQPLYGPPYAGPPYAGSPYAAGPPTSTLAILALVFAFIFPPAGIVLGHVARTQIRQTGEAGDGLAVAGLWIGYLITGLYALACAGWAILVFASVVAPTMAR